MSPSCFPIKAANTVIMYRNDQITFELPDLQDLDSLMLCWRSFSACSMERVALSFSYKASEHRIDKWPQPIAMLITNDARSIIVDTYFAMGVSTICHQLIWYSISVMVFWQPLYRLHVLSPSSLHCSLIIHINIFFKIYFKVSTDCR